tara:strand:+ start:7545 stop:8957 length:1413 start_codon:yes stop_codon:yes gene_type:complete
MDNNLNLHNILSSLPTHVILRFNNSKYPLYVPGTDIDILVSCLDTSEKVIRDLYDKNTFHLKKKIIKPNVQVHVDLFNKKNNRLNLKFDLYAALPYTRFTFHPGLYKNILANREYNGQVWVPNQKDDLALRYAEYIEYKEKRPDKIKHLHYVNKTGVKFTRVQPNTHMNTLDYNSCEDAFFGLIVWGHGLQHLVAIFEMLHKSIVCQVMCVNKIKPTNLEKFIQILYSEDLSSGSHEMHSHIKKKTEYLKRTPQECVFILFKKKDMNIVSEFDNDIVDFKWDVRSKFNPKSKSQRACGRLPQGVTHNHVIHGIDRPGECDAICKYITGHDPKYFEHDYTGLVNIPKRMRLKHNSKKIVIPISKIRASIIGQGKIPLNITPQYKFICGEEEEYNKYYMTYCGTNFTDGHSSACFRRTLANFNPKAYPYDDKKYILVSSAKNGTWNIMDGVHRASALCHHFGMDCDIPCILI